MWSILLISALAIKSEGCRVACLYQNFDSGYFQKGKCVCVQLFEYKDIVIKSKATAIQIQSPEPKDEL